MGETETGEIWESKRSGEVECGLGKGTAVYKCTISTVYLWFCRLYHFCCVSIFLNANYIHSKCPTFDNMKTKLKFIYFFYWCWFRNTAFGWLFLCSSGGLCHWMVWNMILWLFVHLFHPSILPSHYHHDLGQCIFCADFCCVLIFVIFLPYPWPPPTTWITLFKHLLTSMV